MSAAREGSSGAEPVRESDRNTRVNVQLIHNSQIWGPNYLKQRLRQISRLGMPPLKRMWVAIADHFEPRWRRPDLSTAQSRVALWRSAWPAIAKRCKPDSLGNTPRYTFFFPEEEYHPTLMAPLAEMARKGIADVEVHLHHDGEGRQNFIDRITSFCNVLDRTTTAYCECAMESRPSVSFMAIGLWTILGRMGGCAASTMKLEFCVTLVVMQISLCRPAILQPKRAR